MSEVSKDYRYKSEAPSWSNAYIWPAIQKIIATRLRSGARIIDVGCGNGATSNMLAGIGFDVIGIDPSKTGIAIASDSFPSCKFYERSAYDDLSLEFGQFDAVVSLEVVEHCFAPRDFARTVYKLLKPDGVALISTPFHGYWKNVALALAGKFDSHWSPLWDGGHIKFWSEHTLRLLLEETGFNNIDFHRIGRVPPFAKSMLAVAYRRDA